MSGLVPAALRGGTVLEGRRDSGGSGCGLPSWCLTTYPASVIRTLAPPRRPIALQRWSARRVTLAAAMLALFAVPLHRARTRLRAGPYHDPGGPGGALGGLPALFAALPSGWTTLNAEIASGRASFGLDSGSPAGGGGVRFVLGRPGQLQTRVTITLTATCDIADAQQVPSDQPGMRRFERAPSQITGHSGVRYYTFPGGCATYQFASPPGASPALAAAAVSAVAFMPRSVLVGYVRRTEALALCGRGAACPG
jgi:hypothetical protein